MPSSVRRVAVIGAGPAGAIATDALAKEQAFDTIRVFERRPAVGGLWNYTPHLPAGVPSLAALKNGTADEPVDIPASLPAVTEPSRLVNGHQERFSDTPLHAGLHTNIVPEIMSFTQEPLPAGEGPKRHHIVVRDWVDAIFSRGGHHKRLELSTTVERAEKVAGEWVLTLRKEQYGRNYWWRETFDAVVVASGHYNVPWFPEIEGLLEWEERRPGRVVHSKHFRGKEQFAGKRVIVLGGSVSSTEVLYEVLTVAEKPVYASLRGDPVPAFGWEPFTHPHIEVKKQITRVDPETSRVFFKNGTHLDNVDHIVLGTGYTFSLPFLPDVQKRIKQAYRRLPGVWQHTWNIEDPSLTFVGMVGGGFTFRVYEYQAVAVARHLAGRAKALPPVPEMLEWERKRVAEKGGGKNYYSIAPNYKDFFELLIDIAGEPAPGTTGRVLPLFDDKLLVTWADMGAWRLQEWRQKRQDAERKIKQDALARL